MNTQATSGNVAAFPPIYIGHGHQHHQAQAELAKLGIHDLQFDSWIEARQAELDKNVRTALEKSKTGNYGLPSRRF